MMGMSVAAGLSVAWMAWALSGSVISPNRIGGPASEIPREQELLRRLEEIGARFSGDSWRRYDELASMRRAEVLVPDSPEHAELVRMTGELESCHADRLALAAELATIRGVSLAEVLKGGEIAVWNHG